MGPSDVYPDRIAEAALRTGLFGEGDAPGYTSSMWSDYGYGATAGTPYAASSLASSGGNDIW
jgi:hypothetical protein